MMGMIAHHTGNLLEFGSSNRPHVARLSRCTSNDSSSSSSCDMPEMITSASLQSFSESDGGDSSLNDSLSSSGRRSQSPAMSPRSIFHSYWSSPQTKTLLPDGINSDGGGDDRADDTDVLERLRTLKLPLSDDGNDGVGVAFPARPAALVVVVRPTAARVSDVASLPRRPSIDDDGVVDHSSSATTSQCDPSTTISTPRRQILPSPPPPTVVTLMRMLLPPPEDHYYDEYDYSRPSAASRRNSLTRRPWSSTTALGGRGGGDRDKRCSAPPSRSCLRKSRYSSLSSSDVRDLAEAAALRLHPGLRNPSSPDMSRSVSFYSEVSVLEYAVPREQRRSQEGWSRYFA